MKKYTGLIIGAFSLLLSSTGFAANFPYPAEKLLVKGSANAPKDGSVLEITAPAEYENLAKWCTIELTIPGELKFSPDWILEGKATAEAEQPPTHVSCQIATADGKVGFIMLVKSPTVKSQLALLGDTKKVIIPPNSKSQEPWGPNDVIKKITVYSSFATPMQSKFILHEFKIKNAAP